jgi:hypothetical protein
VCVCLDASEEADMTTAIEQQRPPEHLQHERRDRRMAAVPVLVGALIWLLVWQHGVRTHGTTQHNEMRIWLGLTWMDSAKFLVLPFVLLIPGIRLITRRTEQRQSDTAKVAGMVAVGTLIALAVTTAGQLSTFDWGSYTETFEGQQGIVKLSGPLQGLASLVLTASIVIVGIAAVRRRVIPTWLVVALAIGAATTFYLTPPLIFPGLAWVSFGLWLLIAPQPD